MRELKKQFDGKGQVKGYEFNQILATPYGYIYAVSHKGVVRHHEVFKRIENNYYNVVSYPTDKAFGKWAWTAYRLLRAKIILKSIERAETLKLEAL
jgi:hypothetical protein